MTPAAQKLVVDRLSSYDFDSKHKIEIMRIVKFIENGQGSNGQEFLRKMQQTDEYRNQNFLKTHTEIAMAMGYAKN
jgi:hypothetical protein